MTSASRRMRGARGALTDALGLGETFPVRDLPVAAAPAVVPFGGGAEVVIEDTEPGVTYRLRDQAGRPLPRNAEPSGTGTGETLTIATPKIEEDVTFTVEAVTPSGRLALLHGTGTVKVGLDANLPAALRDLAGPPHVIDHGAIVTVVIGRSQEGVAYRLIARPAGDTAAADDFAAVAADIALSGARDVMGTGGDIEVTSLPLADDATIRVRVIKNFGTRSARGAQTTLLVQPLPVFVRADRSRPLAVEPPISDHEGAPTLTVADAQRGVRYAAHIAPVADAAFTRAEPPDPAALAIDTPDGPVRVLPPARPALWDAPPPGFAAAGAPAEGAGAALALPLPALPGDTLILVEARKAHGEGGDAFESAVPLDAAAVALVRPDPSPGLRLEARVDDGKLTGLIARAGQPGVFYALAAGDQPLGELYIHQVDPGDPRRNKGVDQLAIGVDLVVAADATGAAPPPLARLDLTRELPLDVTVIARRAQTRLAAPLAAKIAIAPPPAVTLEPAEVAAGGSAKVTLAAAAADARHALLVDGEPLADPVAGDGGALVLETGPLAAGAAVALWIVDAPGAAAAVERRVALPLKVA